MPQSIPALTAVSLFHFFFAWNDFFTPLVYLISPPNCGRFPLAYSASTRCTDAPNLIQTGALITLVLPVVIFFLAQRVFMQGVVFTALRSSAVQTVKSSHTNRRPGTGDRGLAEEARSRSPVNDLRQNQYRHKASLGDAGKLPGSA